MIRKLLLLSLAQLPCLASADMASPKWGIDLDTNISQQDYSSGSLRTVRALLEPTLDLGNLNLYMDAPFESTKAGFDGPVRIPGSQGRLTRSSVATKNRTFTGLADVTTGATYTVPLDDDDVDVTVGASYKFDNGKAGHLQGSGTSDLTTNLDTGYHWRQFSVLAGVGQTWVDGNRKKMAGLPNSYVFWSAGMTYKPVDKLKLGLSYSDQQNPAAGIRNPATTSLSVDWEVSKTLTANAVFDHYASPSGAGEPERETTLGLSWHL